MSPGDDEAATTGTFLVTAADEDSAVLKDVTSGQIHALSSNPGVERDEVVEGAVAPDPPLEVSWELVEIDRRWTIPIERSEQSPTTLSRDIAADQPVGELTRRERAGAGELHVLTVSEDGTAQVVDDVVADRQTTLARAARMGVSRVEIRSGPGVVVIRYMP